MSNNLFGNLTTDNLEEAQDRVGGSFVVPADIYTGPIKAFYAGQSQGGAHNITLIVDGVNGREYRETVYITNRKGENFFLNKQDQSKKVPLPGFTIINDICLMITGEGLAEQTEWEEKVFNVYDPEQGKEVPTSVNMLMSVIGQDISLGIIQTLELQQEKKGDGSYGPKDDGSTRDVNSIDKVFHPEEKMTVAEARNGVDSPDFWDKWIEANKGKVRDKTKGKNAAGGAAGAPPKAGDSAGSGKPAKSLFGNKK